MVKSHESGPSLSLIQARDILFVRMLRVGPIDTVIY